MTGNDLAGWAAELAQEQLHGLPRRWRHVAGVARRAALATELVDDAALLVAAAWLHDIGYAPKLVRTGFHPVDGATYLAQIGASDRLCALVANHSCACVEARNRGVPLEWEDEQTSLRDALWWADMTTTAAGDDTTFDERVADVYRRYGPDHVVSRSIREATPDLREAVARTEVRLQSHVK
ncbi:HD domain-containing protein [Nocardia aobensis]|uniref:HD domain-containing protein n=1 Tax=Nocardia aobensis TaxID=257277 RepID=UPI000566CD26|nr:HD domain-containing protein [Nocardia aobensis]